MNVEVIEAFRDVAREKNIDRDKLESIVENIFLMMLKKKYSSVDNFKIIVNMDKGEVEIHRYRTIVENVENPATEITLEEAQKIEPDMELGEQFIDVMELDEFGRRLIISAKQNLSQKIKEAEKEVIFNEYKNRAGEIIIGDINQINRNEMFINIDKTEVVMPKSEQIYNERYRRGETIRAVIKDVVRTNRGPEVIVSRVDTRFLVRLFEIEVPEIYDGVIEIKEVSREAGDRAKVAVESSDKRVDPVGACVGMKGIRIQSIVKELNNEKIDIINYNKDPEIYISQALSPAKPIRIDVNREEKIAKAVIPDDQISLAIGKGGQNIRLASALTGYKIDTIKESDELKREESKIDIIMVESLSENIRRKLIEAGFETADDVLDAGKNKLLKINGVGEKTAGRIIELLSTFYEEEPI